MAKNKMKADHPLLTKKRRKLSLGDAIARRRITAYSGPKAHQKMNTLIHVFNRAAPGLALSQNAVRMMAVLWSKTDAKKDFQKGQIAIVWPKTATIMIECGWTSIKSYKRAQSELRQAGLLSYQDSSNGVRYGKRDEEGYILKDQSFGFVLTPLAAAYDEMIKIGDQYENQQKYKRMVSANYIRAKSSFNDLYLNLIEYVSAEEVAPYADQYDNLRGRYKRSDKDFKLKESIIRRLESVTATIKARIEDITANSQLPVLQELEADQDHMSYYLKESTLKRGQNDPTIIPITVSSPSLGNGLSDKKVAETEAQNPQKGFATRQLEKIKAIEEADAKSKRSKYGAPPSFKQVSAAMPFDISRNLRDDHGFHELWDRIVLKAPEYGIEPMMTSYGRREMGIETACAVMAVIFDKTDINKPDRYFTKLVKLHKAGLLRIEASLFGIMDRRKKSSQGEQYGFALA